MSIFATICVIIIAIGVLTILMWLTSIFMKRADKRRFVALKKKVEKWKAN